MNNVLLFKYMKAIPHLHFISRRYNLIVYMIINWRWIYRYITLTLTLATHMDTGRNTQRRNYIFAFVVLYKKLCLSFLFKNGLKMGYLTSSLFLPTSWTSLLQHRSYFHTSSLFLPPCRTSLLQQRSYFHTSSLFLPPSGLSMPSNPTTGALS